MNRHPSGKDLSGEIVAAPHGPEVFERYPQVGVLKKGPPEELKPLPGFLQNLLLRFPMARSHPHPVMVHFPIAFLIAASLFTMLHLFFEKPSFETTGFYLLILGSMASPFAITTGILTCWINYRMKMTRLIRRKMELSVVLLVFEIVLVLWRSADPQGSPQNNHPIYYVMMLILTPIVFLLGYYGGQMTFPLEK